MEEMPVQFSHLPLNMQIVGLTASVGAGRPSKSKPLEAAMKHIQKLCAQLDCSLQKVVREIDNLREYEKTKKRSGCLFFKYANSCCIGISYNY